MSLLDTASLIVTPNGYKEGKLYSVIPSDGSGDLSVTRATTATRVNSAGLVELVPYNLAQYSEQFDNVYWTKLNATITANATTAPNGTLTADKLVENTALNSHRFLSTAIETTISNQYTVSIYLKAAERNYAYVRLNNSGGDIATANIDLVNGIVSQSVIGTFVVTSVGNGWFRVTGTGTSVSSSNAYIEVRTSNSAIYANYTGDGVSGIYAWGAQIVEGSTAKNYQKTETRLNISRLDYSNGTCPSILVEPQRTNRILWSEEFTNAAWSAIDTTISANTTISPEGIQNADTMAISSSTSRIFQYTGLGAGTYTASVYVKALSGTPTIQFRMVVDGADITDSIPTTTEWVRHDFTFTASASMDYFVLRGESGTGSVAIWGAQLELGSYSSSFIPTTSASVTRNADVISKTGISSLIGQTEGTLFIDTYIDNRTAQTNDPVLIYVKGTSAEAYIEFSDSGRVYGVFFDGSPIGFIDANAGLQNGRHKIAFGYKDNNFTLFLDGTEIGTDTSGVISGSLTEFGLQYYDNFFRGAQSVNAAALWKTRLTNTQLAQLTTI